MDTVHVYQRQRTSYIPLTLHLSGFNMTAYVIMCMLSALSYYKSPEDVHVKQNNGRPADTLGCKRIHESWPLYELLITAEGEPLTANIDMHVNCSHILNRHLV